MSEDDEELEEGTEEASDDDSCEVYVSDEKRERFDQVTHKLGTTLTHMMLGHPAI